MNTTATTHPAAQLPDRKTWFGLGILMLPVLLVSMDFSVLYLAMPFLTDQLRPSASNQLWILDIYGFLLAGLLITMGNLGDRLGRRRLLMVGAALFGAASAMAAFSTSAEMLIAARALMGIGGATLLPSSLSLISTMFPDARSRSKAIGIWTAAFAGGSAVGPVIGGILLHHFWWGSVLLINVPVVMVLLLIGPRVVPEFRSGTTDPFDIPGVFLSMAGILPLIYAIKHAAAEGISVSTVAIGVVGLVLMVAFIRQQQLAKHPLLDLHLFSNARFTVAISSSLTGMMAMAATAYLAAIYLQSVLGMDVLDAALLTIPMAIAVATISVNANRVVEKLGVRWTFVAALGTVAVGNLLFFGLGVEHGKLVYVAASVIAGIGYGLAFALVSDVAVGSVEPSRAGAATGISETSFELGNALGLALIGSVAALVFRSGDSRFGDTLTETLSTAGTDSALADAARQSFVDGLHVAAACGAGLVAVVAVIAAVVLAKR